MRGSNGRRTALVLWAAFAFVTWNLVFDRHVYLAAVQFTQAQIQRYERGEPVSSINDAYTPQLGRAVARASVWGGAVLAAGIVLIVIVERWPRK